MPATITARSRILLSLICVLAFSALIYLKLVSEPIACGSDDPDRYYHLAISRMTAQKGEFLREIPQLVGIRWDKYYPDKEFLMHLLTTLGYKLAGERGALAYVPVLGTLITTTFCWLLIVLGRMPPTLSIILALGFAFASPSFSYRIFLLRPHMLAIFSFVWMVGGLLLSYPLVTALAGAVFALSYHALYMPALALCLYGVICTLKRDSAGIRTVLAGVLGLVIGIFINPYFPSQLYYSWLGLSNALGVGVPELNKGAELLTPSSVTVFQSTGLALGALLAAFTVSFRQFRLKRPQDLGLLFALVLAVSLYVLSYVSSRVIEYLIPAAVLLTAASWRTAGDDRKLVLVILSLGLTISLGVNYRHYANVISGTKAKWVADSFAAVRALPSDSQGSLVFNCNWTEGSILLYERPDLRFIDFSDPLLLYHANRELHDWRWALAGGAFSKPAEVIRKIIKADFVTCDVLRVRQALENDPRVKVLGPRLTSDQLGTVAYDLRGIPAQ